MEVHLPVPSSGFRASVWPQFRGQVFSKPLLGRFTKVLLSFSSDLPFLLPKGVSGPGSDRLADLFFATQGVFLPAFRFFPWRNIILFSRKFDLPPPSGFPLGAVSFRMSSLFS